MFNSHSTSKNHLAPILVDNISLELNNRLLINGISCQINAKGISVIMGPNGAGKSLFMRCLHGLATPNSGQIFYAEKPLSPDIQKQQSMVFQSPTILRRTVLANMLFVARQRGQLNPKTSIEYLAQVQLEHLAQHPARLLSGGEKQRLALARALITRPTILFLDEATSNLDPTSTETIEKNLQLVDQQGTKIILVTHDIGQAKRLADDVLFLNRGILTEHGPARSFFKSPASAAAKSYLAGQLVL
ncbi:ATP-binding cassette domain-containing protein [Candidatus Puniceispirillum sp.]|nr:ATP-binding cassette domain-containing protein [Candidatus Puniceispirillum sp.]